MVVINDGGFAYILFSLLSGVSMGHYHWLYWEQVWVNRCLVAVMVVLVVVASSSFRLHDKIVMDDDDDETS